MIDVSNDSDTWTTRGVASDLSCIGRHETSDRPDIRASRRGLTKNRELDRPTRLSVATPTYAAVVDCLRGFFQSRRRRRRLLRKHRS